MNFDYAIAREFYRKTAFEMASELQQLIKSQPSLTFEEMEVGQVVYYATYNNRSEVWRVVKITPARKLADVEYINGSGRRRIAKGSYYGSFFVLNEELISFLGMTHKDVIDEALRRGLEIPARVRIHYAETFTELPERFRAGRLNEFIAPSWGRAVTAKAIDEAINDTHRRIRQLEQGRTKSLAINPPHSKDYDEFIANAIGDLDFYRWVRPHVEVDGVFYLNGEKP